VAADAAGGARIPSHWGRPPPPDRASAPAPPERASGRRGSRCPPCLRGRPGLSSRGPRASERVSERGRRGREERGARLGRDSQRGYGPEVGQATHRLLEEVSEFTSCA
jgi:hypothetical protein